MKLIIIGGVAGGATAAARARRLDENAEIILFERGEFVSFANCGLPYYIGNIIKNRDDLLVTTALDLKDRYKIDVRIFTEVVSIDRGKKQVSVKDLNSGKSYTENYDKLILSPGAEPAKPKIDGIDNENIFRLRDIPDTDRIKALLDVKKPESAVIIGAGFIGLEMAENLVERGIKTTVIEMLDQFVPQVDYEMASIVQIFLKQKGVICKVQCPAKSFEKRGGRTVVVTSTGEEIECDMVLMSIGVTPENKLAKECGLDTGSRGGIIVDGSMKTSDPDIYAVGDAVEVKNFITGRPEMVPLAGPANKQGRIAADNALGRSSVFKGTQGTAILKVFKLVAASTGLNEKSLQKNDIAYQASYTHSLSHAGYYPDAELMSVKILFNPNNGRLLGAQIVGFDGVDKRIDVLATAVRSGLSVFDLEELELAYTPPFSSAKDPVNVAGFVASNIIRADVKSVTWNELKTLKGKVSFIDMRDDIELEMSGTMKGAVNIPLNDLRSSLDELDKTKTYVAFCAAGLRSYIGCRILMQKGFRVLNLSGGFTTYQYVKHIVEN
ncbi:MAG: FAD-dependent oxidoreductase [Spirochaetes bacterium]|nr:FAD-dependent oxidoreductase [Spirochaetota bacterium]